MDKVYIQIFSRLFFVSDASQNDAMADVDDVRVSVNDVKNAVGVRGEVIALRGELHALTEIVKSLQQNFPQFARGVTPVVNAGESLLPTPHPSAPAPCTCGHKYFVQGTPKTCQKPAKFDEKGVDVGVGHPAAVACGKHKENKARRRVRADASNSGTSEGVDDRGMKRSRDALHSHGPSSDDHEGCDACERNGNQLRVLDKPRAYVNVDTKCELPIVKGAFDSPTASRIINVFGSPRCGVEATSTGIDDIDLGEILLETANAQSPRMFGNYLS